MDDTMSGVFSWSQLYGSNVCEWKWALRYIRKVYTHQRYRAPTIGSAVHEGIAGALLSSYQLNRLDRVKVTDDAYGAIGRWAKKEIRKLEEASALGQIGESVYEEAIEMIPPCEHEASKIAKNWIEWHDWDRWQTVESKGLPIIELAFSVPVFPNRPERFMGILDWCARDRETNLTHVIDWKVRTSGMTPPEHEETNLQKAAYQYMLARHGVHTDGSQICQIWHEAPKIPVETTKEQMSRAKIRTTWEVWRTEAIALGYDPDEDYPEMEDKCNSIEDYFRWSPSYRTLEEVDNIWRHVIQERVKRLITLHKEREPALRSLGSRDCNFCYARETCMEDLRGRPWDSALLASGLYYRGASEAREIEPNMDEEFEFDNGGEQ